MLTSKMTKMINFDHFGQKLNLVLTWLAQV